MRPAIPFCAGVGLLRSYLASVAIILTAYATPWEPDLENPRTITPFQTAAYVADLEAARLLNGLAEFAVGLLIWDDTDRLIATQVGTLLPKGLLAPFFAEHNSGLPARLKADSVRDRVSDAYRNLRSPRLVDVEIHHQIAHGALPTIEAAEAGTPIPFRVTNRRDQMIELVLQEFAGADRPGQRKALLLAPGETRGFFWTLPAGLTGPTLRLTAAAGDLSRTLDLPLRRRASVSQSFLVLDETGEPTPARIYAKGADGRARAPAGVMQRVVTGEYSQPFPGEVYFYTSGRFTLQLPVGIAEIEVVKGMEYHPLRIDLDVKPNSTGEIPLKLMRMANLGSKGWHSGDNHVHANLFYEDRIKPADVMIIAKAEDLNVVNVLPCNDPRT